MAARSVVTLTTAPAGTGKSYRRCAHFIVTELLPETELKHLSNFPIKFEPWHDGNGKPQAGLIRVCEARQVATEDEIIERIELIPEQEMERWRDGQSGPWEFFADKDLSGYHLAIDEIHNFCGKNTHVDIRKKWQTWLGELRHRGARIEFISQHPQKIAKEIRDEAEILLELVAGETQSDPFFGIEMGDWYNFRAKITGKYKPVVFEHENRQTKSRWSVKKSTRFWFESDLFECYDSFSAPVQGGGKGTLGKEPWERHTWPRFLLWFTLRNLLQLSSRLAIVLLFAWLSIGGGGQKTMAWGMAWMKNHVQKDPTPVEKQSDTLDPQQEKLLADLKKRFPGAIISSPARTAATSRPLTPSDATPPIPTSPKPEPITEEEISAELDPWALTAVTDDGIWFASGEYYLIGEKINEGPYKGLSVSSVDLERRRAVIGDASVRLRSIGASKLRDYARKIILARRDAEVRRLLPAGHDNRASPSLGRSAIATPDGSDRRHGAP